MTREDRGASSFDELASGLASGSISRGNALKLMGAALVGGTLGSLGGVAAADDECKPLNKKCRKDTQCCSGNCVNRACAACPAGTVELNGACAMSCTNQDQCLAAGCDPNNTGCEFDSGTNARYCRSSGGLSTCTSTADCLTGQFCARAPFSPQGFCVVVC
jgi:hypothetical protein